MKSINFLKTIQQQEKEAEQLDKFLEEKRKLEVEQYKNQYQEVLRTVVNPFVDDFIKQAQAEGINAELGQPFKQHSDKNGFGVISFCILYKDGLSYQFEIASNSANNGIVIYCHKKNGKTGLVATIHKTVYLEEVNPEKLDKVILDYLDGTHH